MADKGSVEKGQSTRKGGFLDRLKKKKSNMALASGSTVKTPTQPPAPRVPSMIDTSSGSHSSRTLTGLDARKAKKQKTDQDSLYESPSLVCQKVVGADHARFLSGLGPSEVVGTAVRLATEANYIMSVHGMKWEELLEDTDKIRVELENLKNEHETLVKSVAEKEKRLGEEISKLQAMAEASKAKVVGLTARVKELEDQQSRHEAEMRLTRQEGLLDGADGLILILEEDYPDQKKQWAAIRAKVEADRCREESPITDQCCIDSPCCGSSDIRPPIVD